MATEAAEDSEVIRQDRVEDLAAQVVDVVVGQPDAAGMGRVLDDMHKQADEAVNEILPCTRALREALLQQLGVNLGERHGGTR